MLNGNNDTNVPGFLAWVSQYLAKTEDVLDTFADTAPKEGTTAPIAYYKRASFTLEMTKALVSVVDTYGDCRDGDEIWLQDTKDMVIATIERLKTSRPDNVVGAFHYDNRAAAWATIYLKLDGVTI